MYWIETYSKFNNPEYMFSWNKHCFEKQTKENHKKTWYKTNKHKSTFRITPIYVKNTTHNFSSYQLSNNELTALLYGLDHHISSKVNGNRIYTEFEQFYQSLVKDIPHLPYEDLSHLKTKLRNTCD